jgi:hypothetical protein
MELAELVLDFATAFKIADALRPQALSHRSGKPHQPGLGPHGENAAVRLVVNQLALSNPGRYSEAGQVRYPNSRLTCDLGIGNPLGWALDVKMLRALGDNGRPDDTYLHEILSPYESDHSALTDSIKLRPSGFVCPKAVLIYGFDYVQRPLEPAIHALEILMRNAGPIGPRREANFADLVHPVHRNGRVLAWEVLGPGEPPS